MFIHIFIILTLQPRIDSHFMTYQQNSRFAKVASVRLTTAISQITGKNLVPTVTRSPPAKQTKARKRKKTDGTDGDAPANQESNSQ